MTLESFAIMVRNHDLTYMYSDDKHIWARGEKTLDRIKEAAKEIPREDAVRIWNTQVDQVLIESARASFYWKV